MSDQGGAFEVVSRGTDGQCLRQQVHRPGIDWAGATYAYSVLGEERWNDLKVSVDTCFEALPEDIAARGERFMGVLARWHPGATWIHFKTPYPAGYQFRLFGDGRWELTTARRIVAEGKTDVPDAATWRSLELHCVGNQITASLDGKVMAQVCDSTYQRGLAGISSRFHPARYDNLQLSND